MEPTTTTPDLQLAQVSSNNPNKNYSHVPAMCLGRYNKKHIYRILALFPVTSIPPNATITHASMKLYMTVPGIQKSYKVTAHMITQPWIPDKVTWNNQPTYAETTADTGILVSKSGPYTFDLTEMVKLWYTAQQLNHGFIIKNSEHYDGTYSRVTTEMNFRYSPVVQITYTMPCNCECTVRPAEFIETAEVLHTGEMFSYSSLINTSLIKIMTFFIKNTGHHPVSAKLQVSPDGNDFVDDNYITEIKANEVVAITPYYYAKFTRVGVKNINSLEMSSVAIWYQCQQ